MTVMQYEVNAIKGKRFQFFQSVEPNPTGFMKFLNGVARTHDANPLEFELAVERCVWDVTKFDFQKYVTRSVQRSSD